MCNIQHDADVMYISISYYMRAAYNIKKHCLSVPPHYSWMLRDGMGKNPFMYIGTFSSLTSFLFATCIYKSGYRGSDGPLAVSEVIPLPVITDAFLKGMVSMGHPTRDCNGEEMIGKLISLEVLHMVHVSVKWKR